MDTHKLARRALRMQGSTALAGLALLHSPRLAQAFPPEVLYQADRLLC